MDIDIVVAVIQTLTGILLGIIGWWLIQLNGRVRDLEVKVATYEGDVRVANEKLVSIDEKIGGHILREEHETWGKIDALGGEVADMRVSMATMVTELKGLGRAVQEALAKVVDHDKEATDWKHRIVALEAVVNKHHPTP